MKHENYCIVLGKIFGIDTKLKKPSLFFYFVIVKNEEKEEMTGANSLFMSAIRAIRARVANESNGGV